MRLSSVIKGLITGLAVAAAAACVWLLWQYYEYAPRTPDGRVRADVVQVAPDVSGLVTQVFVYENQIVAPGDPLFEIDAERFAIALDLARATLAARQAALAHARRVHTRNQGLGELVSDEVLEESRTRVDELTALVAQDRAHVDLAQLNLDRTRVVSTVHGKVTNFALQPGQYARAGQPVFALVDMTSFRVEGYFEETKLRRIQVGDPARITLMGQTGVIEGHVQGIAGGIEDSERRTGGSLLADVKPTFNWVRLAQRIPVRIALDTVPDHISLVIGQTASVAIDQQNRPADAAPTRAPATTGTTGPTGADRPRDGDRSSSADAAGKDARA
ncbi:hypothetical protein CCR85_09875 [Rhodothalassium salexigens]|uniref:efflux RND transporter periplasmic adaptor subunit n=1 Tax=Rhodothalassium salexigens TaxID=1086 RepID=UPI001911D4B4|nr:HlyD family secretion protein [Rhodothalassium salexigens]MBK5911794.1 hypothetical protein [Rhodothalassium salexigens]MBK5920352.1 hypothetical protein [Rhodothalassium salexigens]